MKTRSVGSSALSLGIFSAIAFAVLPLTSHSTVAQTNRNASTGKNFNESLPSTQLASISDLSQYSPEAAPKLQLGSKGAPVRDIQAFLKEQGYYTGTLDGVYGSTTANAVKAFQQKRERLNNDGIVGYSTWNAMIQISRNPSISN